MSKEDILQDLQGCISIDDYKTCVEKILDGVDYEIGQLEAIESRAKQNSRALGSIIYLLRTKGLLSIEETVDILSLAQF
jgi:hypothetical protein